MIFLALKFEVNPNPEILPPIFALPSQREKIPFFNEIFSGNFSTLIVTDVYYFEAACGYTDEKAGKCADIPLIDNIIKIYTKVIASMHTVRFGQ